jgi:hypothetical protein
MSFKVATTHAEVTREYIRASLEHHYRSKGYKISDDMVTLLEFDYKRKVDNLDWLFQGKTRVRISPSKDEIYKSVLKEQTVSDFLGLISKVLGASYDISLIEGYVTVNKQKTRISKAKEMLVNAEIPSDLGSLGDRYTKQTFLSRKNPYRRHSNVDGKSHTIGFRTTNNLVIRPVGLTVIVGTNDDVQRRWHNLDSIDTERVYQLTQGGDVVLSMDINDYITCSSGSVSSCMGFSGSYHLGWMMHFRSDFSLMAFTHDPKDQFHKIGRSWVFVKLTENGEKFARPFYKISKPYGSFTASHCKAIDATIQSSAKAIGFIDKPKRVTDCGWGSGDSKWMVSPNMRNVNGILGSSSGYFDWQISDTTPIVEYAGEYKVTPFSSGNYRRGPVTLLNFPDALDVFGEFTMEGSLTNSPNHPFPALHGWNEHFKQFVECSLSGKRVPVRDAIKLADGTWVDKFVAAKVLSGKSLTVEDEPVVPQVQPDEPEIDLDSVDVEDF